MDIFEKKMAKIMNDFELAQYMSTAIEMLVKEVVRSTFHNPEETAFLIKYAKSMKVNSQKRLKHENSGQYIHLRV